MPDDYTLKDRIKDLGDSISEQFRNLARQLEAIEGKLDGKASLAQLAELEDRLTKALDRLDRRTTDLEKQSWGAAAVSKTTKFWIGIVCSGLVGTLLYLAAWGRL